MGTPFEDEVLQELRIVRGLMVASLIRSMGDEATQRDRIALLANAGIGSSEIASILGTTPHTVSVALTDLRKTGKVKPVKTTARKARVKSGE